MIYVNEYTGEQFETAAECEKAEKAYLEAKKKKEEKARLDKAKREAKEKEDKAKIKAAYEKAIKTLEAATEATEEYFKLCKELGYHVDDGAEDCDDIMGTILKLFF